MRKTFLRIGSLFALIAVALGAFASHGLRAHLTAGQIDTFQIGVRYQFYHSLAILLVCILIHFGKKPAVVAAGWLFTAGIIFFSGSLYLLATREMLGLRLAWLGPVTPIGGTLFLIGWALLFLSTFKQKPKNNAEAN